MLEQPQSVGVWQFQTYILQEEIYFAVGKKQVLQI